MSRRDEIDSLLKHIRDDIKSGKMRRFVSKDIYSYLMNYGLSDDEISHSGISDSTINEIYNFAAFSTRGRPNLERQLGFLYFDMDPYFDVLESKFREFYKLYLSLPKDCFEEGVKRIFKMLSDNVDCTFTKVSTCARADDVVIRLASMDDAVKITELINNDEFLSKCCRKTNPFLIRDGVVGIGYDRFASYNSLVADVLTTYFLERKKSGELDKVSYNDFLEYVTTLHDCFLKDDFSVMDYCFGNRFTGNHKDLESWVSREAICVGYIDTFDMFMLELDENKTSEDYYPKAMDFFIRLDPRVLREALYRLKNKNKIASFNSITESTENDDEKSRMRLLFCEACSYVLEKVYEGSEFFKILIAGKNGDFSGFGPYSDALAEFDPELYETFSSGIISALNAINDSRSYVAMLVGSYNHLNSQNNNSSGGFSR